MFLFKGEDCVDREDLQQFTSIMEDWIPKDASIAIAIDNRYLHYSAGMHDIRLKEGQGVEAGSIADRTFKQGCKVDALMDDSLFGIPYYGIGYPINLKGEIGVLVVILPPSYHFLKKEPPRFLTGKQKDIWYPVPIEQIAYIESLQKKTWFYAEKKSYCSDHTLKNLNIRLPNSFLRIHRSYIVNIPYIQSIFRDFTSNLVIKLKDGTELPVGPRPI